MLQIFKVLLFLITVGFFLVFALWVFLFGQVALVIVTENLGDWVLVLTRVSSHLCVQFKIYSFGFTQLTPKGFELGSLSLKKKKLWCRSFIVWFSPFGYIFGFLLIGFAASIVGFCSLCNSNWFLFGYAFIFSHYTYQLSIIDKPKETLIGTKASAGYMNWSPVCQRPKLQQVIPLLLLSRQLLLRLPFVFSLRPIMAWASNFQRSSIFLSSLDILLLTSHMVFQGTDKEDQQQPSSSKQI